MEAAQLISTVRHWLSAVRLSADARLPPERELAKKFRVSRAELRKVLAVFEAEGQIQRHVGKGTFVVHPPEDSRPNGEDIAARTSPLAAMQARRAVEPELARLAALNATTAQFVEMRKLCSEMRRTPTWEAYEELDWRFHNLIGEATGNVLLVEIQRLLNGVRRFVVWGDLVKRAEGPPSAYRLSVSSRSPTRQRSSRVVHTQVRAPAACHCRASSSVAPLSLRTAWVSAPGAPGGRGLAAGVRSKRGAGAACKTPSCLKKVPRAALCGCSAASVKVNTGPAHASLPSKRVVHSSRVRRRNTSA